MEISDELVAGKSVLLVWSGSCDVEDVKRVVENLRVQAGEGGSISLEHAERLIVGKTPIP